MRVSSCLTALSYAVLANGIIIPQFSTQGRLTGTSFGIPSVNATYDYVIIGGGLAGSVMAARLTENSNATVAVVEAGSFYELTNGNWSQVPFWSEEWAGPSTTNYNQLVDWGLITTPQVNGQSVRYTQGKCLGGSSGRNQMLYHRPTEGFYNKWADHVGDQAYTWENMTTYLERSMTFTPPNATAQNSYETVPYDASAFLSTRNSSNPLQVSYPSYYQQISAYAPAGFEAIGLEQQPGLSSGRLNGYATWTFTIDPATGLRSSAESAFLQPALTRNNLAVYLNTMAQNIIFSSNKTAIGVNVTSSPSRERAQYYTLTARKEVLVAAGAYHSPQVLMLSGIGPASTLSQYGIPVISNLTGVGQKTWDTANVGGPIWEMSSNFTTSSTLEKNTTFLAEANAQLVSSGTGPLTNIGTDIVAFYKIPAANSSSNTSSIFSSLGNATRAHLATYPADWPEIEMQFASASRDLEATDDPRNYGSITVLLIATASQGNMTITSNSIYDAPQISPNWILDPRDQEIAVAGYKLARRFWDAVPDGVKLGQEVYPGQNVTSDADLLSAIIENLSVIHHVCGSCAMGKVGDEGTVIDSRGRVVGVQGVRVVDSAGLPFGPPGHTQGLTYSYVERMADFVLDDWS